MQVIRNSITRSPSFISPISFQDHDAAWNELRSWPEYRWTPLLPLSRIAAQCGVAEIWYKDESSRLGLDSFKALGGPYAVLRMLQSAVAAAAGASPSSSELRSGAFANITQRQTVATATDGNHGRAVAWAARLFGCRAVIFIPSSCSRGREDAIRSYGAEVVRTTAGYDETMQMCAHAADSNEWAVISDTSWSGYTEIPKTVMSGYTVLAEEAIQQLPCEDRLTHVFLQAGVGGLAAALSSHFTNRLGERAPKVVVVEPENAACMFASARQGKPTRAPSPVRTIMAGLECAEVSTLAWQILSQQAHAFVTVSDDVVAPMMRMLSNGDADRSGIVAGESAVAGVGALMLSNTNAEARNALGLDSDSRVLVIGTEGATDREVYAALTRTHG